MTHASSAPLLSLAKGIRLRIQIFALREGGAAAEHSIAVRETTETLDDVEVTARKLKRVFRKRAPLRRRRRREMLEMLHALSLTLEVLYVLIRHQQERAFHDRELIGVTGSDGASHDRQRSGVVVERSGGIAERIARKLIENHDERYARSRSLLPGGKLASGRFLNRGSEPLANLQIQIG